jgi:hypothetical protein
MTSISFTGDAAQKILAELDSGRSKLDGIQVREVATGKVRYLIRGLEHLPQEPEKLMANSVAQSLEAAIGMTQLLSAVSVAQNASIALSLRRMEKRLEAVEHRLTEMERRLAGMDQKMSALFAAMRAGPLSAIKTACSVSAVALHSGDRTAMLAEAGRAQDAARNILDQAHDLLRQRPESVPLALVRPGEVVELMHAAAEGMNLCSAIFVSLGSAGAAEGLLREVAGAIRDMRSAIWRELCRPELLMGTLTDKRASDPALRAAAEALRTEEKWLLGRAAMIGAGLIVPDASGKEFEQVKSADEVLLEEILMSEEVVVTMPSGRA